MSSVPSVADIMGEDVARIYEAKGKLSAAASSDASLMAGELPAFHLILASVKSGNETIKQLVADYIPQFLHYFPALTEQGIDAQLDLVEDEKAAIRLHAIRGLERICKNNTVTVRRIAEVLGQLLVSEDKAELNVVRTTFASLFSMDAQASFLALFALSHNEDATVRAKGLEFLQAQLKAMLPTIRKDEAIAAGVAAGLKAMLSGAQNPLIGRDELKFLVQTLLTLTPHHANAAKIRADETLKAELAAIAATQSGVHLLDLSNEASLRHFLSVQGVVSNLSSNYGVDTAAFVEAIFQKLLPNIEAVADANLRVQILRAATNIGAYKLTPKVAQVFFPKFYSLFKQYLPVGEVKAPAAAAAAAPAGDAMDDAAAAAPAAAVASSASSPAINYPYAEVFLYLFHVLAALAPTELRQATGIFTPTGQPGEAAALNSPQRADFNTRIAYLLQSNAAHKETLHAVQKGLQEQLKEFNKQNQQQAKEKKAAAAAAAAAAASAAAPAAATEEKKDDAAMGDAPAAAAAGADAAAASPVAAAAADEDKSGFIVDLRAKQASVNTAIRVAASVALLAKPLQDKPVPTLLPAEKMSLSWREHKAPGKQGGQQQQQQQGQQQKGKQQQQQGKQQPQQKGQKRKSEGGAGQQQAQSHKKGGQQQQAASQKKQAGGQQQQQQQGGQNKRQKQGGQSQSNKGGQKQQQQGNGGGRRRR